MTLLAWTLAALLHFAPPSMHDRAPWADASHDEARARYEHVARAIVAACSDSPRQRECAALLAAIAIGESGIARDADVGPCYRVGSYRTRCDSGRAASVWQVQAWGRDPAGNTITVAMLFDSRELAARQALKAARWSVARCGRKDARDRLSGLSGRCIDGPGPWRSRLALWERLRAWEPAQ